MNHSRPLSTLAALALLTRLNLFAAIIDYHQHLYSPEAGARSTPGPRGISAHDLIAQLDAAGIDRAVVLSVAYSFSNPNKPPVANEYAHVMAENDWTATQVAEYPDRLIGVCSVNPLRPYALAEIARCAKNPLLKTGLKLHFGNSDVDVNNPDHLAQLRRVFHAANQNGMAIVVHARPNVGHHRPYGANEARIFIDALLPEAPDVTIQSRIWLVPAATMTQPMPLWPSSRKPSSAATRAQRTSTSTPQGSPYRACGRTKPP